MTTFLLSNFSTSQEGDNEYLRLTSPAGGWSSSRVIKIEGSTNIKTRSIDVIHNGIPLRLPVANGRFSRKFVAAPGLNLVSARLKGKNKIHEDQVSFFSKAPGKAMKIVLSWDTDRTDIDLWVIEPSGEKCYYGHRNTKNGGSLDVDITNGYGPEIYTLAQPVKGNYKIQVKYYSDRGFAQTQVDVYVVLYEGTPNEIVKKYQTMLTKTGEVSTIDVINLE